MGRKIRISVFLNSEPGGDLYSNYLKIETEVLYPHCTLCDFYGKKNSEGNLLLYNNKLVYVLHNTKKKCCNYTGIEGLIFSKLHFRRALTPTVYHESAFYISEFSAWQE